MNAVDPRCEHAWETNDATLDHDDATHRCIRDPDHRLGMHVCECGAVAEVGP